MRRSLRRLAAGALVALLAGCASHAPSNRDAAAATQALKGFLAADAKDIAGYALVSMDDAQPPGTRAATFEKTLGGSAGAVERTEVAVCNGAASNWRCIGPIEGARIRRGARMQHVVTAGEMDDATILAVADYVGSSCFEEQMGELQSQHGPGYARAHRAGGQLQGIERDGSRFLLSIGDRAGFDIVTLERAAAGAACPFEVQEVRSLMISG